MFLVIISSSVIILSGLVGMILTTTFPRLRDVENFPLLITLAALDAIVMLKIYLEGGDMALSILAGIVVYILLACGFIWEKKDVAI